MGNTRSRVSPSRTTRTVDAQSRAQYQNQRELIRLRQKIADIDFKHDYTMSRLTYKQHEVKTKLQELHYENSQRLLFKKLEKLNRENSTLSMPESTVFEDGEESKLESPSLLLHDLNSSYVWEKSMVLPDNGDFSEQFKSPTILGTLRSQYASKFDTSQTSFAKSESFVLDDKLTLRQHTELMKKRVKIAIAKSKRDSKTIARREAHQY